MSKIDAKEWWFPCQYRWELGPTLKVKKKKMSFWSPLHITKRPVTNKTIPCCDHGAVFGLLYQFQGMISLHDKMFGTMHVKDRYKFSGLWSLGIFMGWIFRRHCAGKCQLRYYHKAMAGLAQEDCSSFFREKVSILHLFGFGIQYIWILAKPHQDCDIKY